MKRNLKKMLLALMVGFSMIGAVSTVQAQGGWVRVSDPTFNGVTGNLDALCVELGRAFCGSSYGKPNICNYDGSYSINRKSYENMVFCSFNSGSKENWLMPICIKGGTWSGERSDGCYEWRDKCPDGTVNEGGVCVKLPYEPYENPAVCGKTDVQIDDGTKRWPDLGAVACDGLEKEGRGVCFWPESHIDQDTKKPDWDKLDLVAQGIIQDCVVEHETVHYNESGNGFYCNVYNRWATPLETSRSDSEKRAYETERACYMREIDRCGSSEACIKDIANEMSLVEQSLEALK